MICFMFQSIHTEQIYVKTNICFQHICCLFMKCNVGHLDSPVGQLVGRSWHQGYLSIKWKEKLRKPMYQALYTPKGITCTTAIKNEEEKIRFSHRPPHAHTPTLASSINGCTVAVATNALIQRIQSIPFHPAQKDVGGAFCSLL